MPKYYTLNVKKIVKLTPDSVQIQFRIDQEIKERFRFRPGQYLTLKTNIEGKEVIRNYSICSSSREDLSIGVKRVANGVFSSFVNDRLCIGDALQSLPPRGKFVVNPSAQHQKNYLAVAVGSGITPILSMMKQTLEVEKKSRFILLYGNKTVGDVMFKKELGGLKNKYTHRLEMFHFMSQEKGTVEWLNGRITAERFSFFQQKYLRATQIDEYLLCGPHPMVEEIQQTLTSDGIDGSKIKFELFAPVNDTAPNSTIGSSVQTTNRSVCKVRVKLDGQTREFQMPAGTTDNILDFLTQQGLQVPYACKGGVCATCKARVVEGSVKMAVNYALEEEELNQGFVITCQAFPAGDACFIDYDV